MTFDEAQKAATALRRSGMSWRDIGKQLGVDKDRLREAITAQGLADGWGQDSMIRSSGSVSSVFSVASGNGNR